MFHFFICPKLIFITGGSFLCIRQYNVRSMDELENAGRSEEAIKPLHGHGSLLRRFCNQVTTFEQPAGLFIAFRMSERPNVTTLAEGGSGARTVLQK